MTTLKKTSFKELIFRNIEKNLNIENFDQKKFKQNFLKKLRK